jgi:hypothetical protein
MLAANWIDSFNVVEIEFSGAKRKENSSLSPAFCFEVLEL